MPSDAQRAHLRLQHLVRLHGGLRGKPWIGRKLSTSVKGKVPFEGGTCAVRDAASSPLLATADYTSLNRFWGHRRLTHQVVSCGHLVLDFDYYRKGLIHADKPHEEVAEILGQAMDAAGVPRPQVLVFTGRGIQVTWVSTGAEAPTLARVRAVYEALHGPVLTKDGMAPTTRKRTDAQSEAHNQRMMPMWRAFRDCGLDRVCKDGARVVRLAGSINGKSGLMARLIHPQAFEDVTPMSFGAFADMVLPYTKAEIRALREARDAGADVDEAWDPQPVRTTSGKPRGKRTGFRGFRHEVLDDLYRALDAGLIAEGRRELWAFHVANAQCLIAGGGSLEAWAEQLAPKVGLEEDELRTSLGNLARRQERDERGETDTYDQREWTPFYHYSAAAMVEEFEFTEEDADIAGMRMLRPSGTIVRSAAERKQAQRDRANPDRSTKAWQARLRTNIGHWALSLRADGMTVEEMTHVLPVGRETIRKAMKAAADELGLPDTSRASCEAYAASPASQVQPKADVDVEASATVEADAVEPIETIGTHHDVSRCIVAGASEPPPAPIQAPLDVRATVPVAPGEVRLTRWTRYFTEIETSSGRWSWHWCEDTMSFPHRWETRLFRDTPSAPLPADQMLVDAVVRDLEASVAVPARRSRRPGRPVPDRRPRGSQRLSRKGFRNLAPLDPDRNLYRLASRGY